MCQKNGDISSINRLVDHYLIFENNQKTALVWARLGADQGDSNLRSFIVDFLSKSPGEDGRVELIKLKERWESLDKKAQ